MHQTICSKLFETKKILVHHSKVAQWLLNYFFKKGYRSGPPEMFYKKPVSGNFAIFTGQK